jgi:hypothetical protein
MFWLKQKRRQTKMFIPFLEAPDRPPRSIQLFCPRLGNSLVICLFGFFKLSLKCFDPKMMG